MVHNALQRADAHERLIERRCTRVHKDRMWINGYEYGLFMTPNDASIMGETLHVNGFIMEDAVSSFIHHLALTYGHAENILCMKHIVWNIQVVQGILKRPDAHMILMSEDILNGYEYVVLHDVTLCNMIGHLIRKNSIPISKVIRFSVFRQSFPENIKALFNL